MKPRGILFGLYVLACAAALTWPVYDLLGNRATPFVFGLPFNLAWNVGWILLTSLALLAFHLTRRRG